MQTYTGVAYSSNGYLSHNYSKRYHHFKYPYRMCGFLKWWYPFGSIMGQITVGTVGHASARRHRPEGRMSAYSILKNIARIHLEVLNGYYFIKDFNETSFKWTPKNIGSPFLIDENWGVSQGGQIDMKAAGAHICVLRVLGWPSCNAPYRDWNRPSWFWLIFFSNSDAKKKKSKPILEILTLREVKRIVISQILIFTQLLLEESCSSI